MKLLCAEYNENGEMTVSVVGDNALLRNNNDFYFPSFTDHLSCVPQIVLKACKLGKGFSERFSHRYFQEIGVGIRFYADTLEAELRSKNLPVSLAASFDESAALSPMQTYEEKRTVYKFQVNEKIVLETDLKNLPVTAERFIAMAGQYYMIKIGDYFYCGNPLRYKDLKINDRLRMYLNDKCLLDFFIK